VTKAETNQILADVHSALEARDVQGAWGALRGLEGELEQDPEVAAVWLDLLRATPSRAELTAEVERVLKRWPDDPVLVTRACDALIRAAERLPPDEPPLEAGPAQLAAAAAERCLAAIERDGAEAQWRSYLRINHANALRLSHAPEQALAAFELALAAEPERGWWWFNLGLLHKQQRAWRECLEANQRARVLLGDEKPVLWNLAISAVALGEGASAIEVLRALGHDAKAAPSGMPQVEGLPPVQVRAATLSAGVGPATDVAERAVGFELLWVTPASPCHGVVSSASYRDASADYGDLVLWDAVPVGMFELEGRAIARFPLLAVLRHGSEHKWRFVALQQQPDGVAKLRDDLPDGSTIFIHQERIEMLCARCASGEHMRKHAHEPTEEHRLVFGKLVLSDLDLPGFKRELDLRLQRHPGVQLVMPGLLEALGDTAAAGKAHQIWRGLVRTGTKLSS
jgi:tetratricopeptide (TPR) repeat protein